jgi:peroxiredoxin
MKKIVSVAFMFFCFVLVHAQQAPHGLQVSDKAPVFTAKDQNNKNFILEEQLKKGPVVVVFYRGQWCPYCNKQLKTLEDSLPMITAKGASLVAVTPEKPVNITKTITKTKVTYPVLFDDGMKVMKAYDVAFAVDNKTIEQYKKYGIDFNEANGSNGANLPVPAVYIISKEGKIVYKYFDADYTKRATVKDILSYL